MFTIAIWRFGLTRVVLERAAHLRLFRFALGEDPLPVRMRGRVVRLAAAALFGIEFIDVEDETSARLRRFLDALEA